MNYKKQAMFPIRAKRQGLIIPRVLFLDPGLTGTGWAYFGQINTKARTFVAPLDSGVNIPKQSRQWEGRVDTLCAWFAGLCVSTHPSLVVLEFPELWINSAVSFSSATRGDLFKLTYLIGGLGEVARRASNNLPILVSPRDWKGQLPKDVVIRRIKRRFPNLKLDNHEADAVGMGLAAQGGL